MSDFEYLWLANGMGPVHVNRFRIYFDLKSGMSSTPGALCADFGAGFPHYFSYSNEFAKTQWGDRLGPSGKKTLQFTGNLPMADFIPAQAMGVPLFHDDWVEIIEQHSFNDVAGFTAQTLKRHFDDQGDQTIRAAGAIVPGPLATEVAVDKNKYHFLSGRRGWAICTMDREVPPLSKSDTPDPPMFFLETAGVERYSRTYPELANEDIFGAQNPVSEAMRGMIVGVWCKMLTNYVRLNAFHLRQPPAGSPIAKWNRAGPVFWTHLIVERARVCALHPYLNQSEDG